MTKENYIEIATTKIKNEDSKKIMLEQINNYYELKNNYVAKPSKYKVGDKVKLTKGTLLHGTYKNFEGLKEIVVNGLISSWFIDGRLSKYPSSVGVWNLKKDYQLKDYINFYSGGTIFYARVFEDGVDTQRNKTAVIPYNQMHKILEITTKINCHMWTLEQTKESRFMPNLSNDKIQIGIIFTNDKAINKLKENDILSTRINDSTVKEFVNENYYEKFIKERLVKDDFFTDRESAILFGIPSNFIEGILVGRNYEQDKNILSQIKKLLPSAYICNLDGIVIVE